MTDNTITANSLWHMTMKAVGVAIGLLTVALMTRYLGRTGFGQYATALAYLQFFGILVDFGLYLVMLSELGKSDDEAANARIVGNILSLRVISALIVLGLAVALAWLLPYDRLTILAIVLLSGAYFFQLINQVLTGIFQKKLLMRQGGLVEIISKLLSLLFIALAWWLDLGLLGVAAGITVANAVGTAIIFRLSRRLIAFGWRVDLAYWREIVRLAWPLAIITVFNLFYFKADTLILSFFFPADVVGLYAAPYRLLEVLISLPPILLGLLLPQLAAAVRQHDRSRWERGLRLALGLFHLFILPVITGTLLLAEPIMVLIAGPAFAASAPLLRILIIATAAIFYSQTFTYALVAQERQRRTLPMVITLSLLAVVLYLIFIPRFSYYAAAVITVGVETVIAGGYYLYLRSNGSRVPWNWRLFGHGLLGSGVMALGLWLVPDWPLLISISVGGLIYLLALLGFGTFRRKEFSDIIST